MPVVVEVKRARAGARSRMIGPRSGELGVGRLETIDMDHVAAQVVDIGKSVVRREGSKVSVRAFLPVGARASEGVLLGPHGRA